ncbi:FxsA family protein [Neiella marina]|uniref:FxsA family protein n=1 Tax=Neiella holothuriorum TaxID=2870530 RepID=A0ABS7EJH3_9GAMM|nr:FxsA family protein [Neiella holothuriorum]MBW8192507.1 FxsA family protein [Neiella holothuriorum]
MPFLLLILLVPVIELTVLVQVGSQIGALGAIGLTILTAIVGLSLVRSQGLSVMQRAQQNMAQGQNTAPEVVEGGMLAFAGLCLLIPGFITDALGALLLLPPLRKQFAKSVLSSRVIRFGGVGGHGSFQQGPFQSRPNDSQTGNTIDGEYERKDDNDRLN